jgi:iron complex transport system substrate-binding protein
MRQAARALGTMLAALALGACGGDSAATENEADAQETATAAACSTVRVSAAGSTEITGTPERVVVLDTGELDSAVALGIEPVGAVEAIAGAGYPAYLADQLEGVEKVGTIEQPNLESIARLEPDLILSSKIRHEAIYDQLSEIAPTVFTEEVGVTWKENFSLHAEALGRVEDAQRLQSEYDDAVDALSDALADRRQEKPEVSVVRSVGDEVRIYLKENFLGTILSDAGLARPEAQDKAEFSETATVERIPDLDGDVMFLSRYGDDHRLLNRLMGNRLWDRLDVVKEDRVYEVPDDLWFLGIGNLAAREVVEDLDTILVDGRRLPGDDGDPTTE